MDVRVKSDKRVVAVYQLGHGGWTTLLDLVWKIEDNLDSYTRHLCLLHFLFFRQDFKLQNVYL